MNPKTLLLGLLLLSPVYGWAQSPVALIEKLENYPHATLISQSDTAVVDHEIGLGAMQKSRGVWQFKTSERVSGLLQRRTWQIVDSFTSLEVYEELIAELNAMDGSSLLFSCGGRSCGQGVQWANRVFGERILYGREDLQRYSVYALEVPSKHRVLVYSSARTADRQYLHLEVLGIGD